MYMHLSNKDTWCQMFIPPELKGFMIGFDDRFWRLKSVMKSWGGCNLVKDAYICLKSCLILASFGHVKVTRENVFHVQATLLLGTVILAQLEITWLKSLPWFRVQFNSILCCFYKKTLGTICFRVTIFW